MPFSRIMMHLRMLASPLAPSVWPKFAFKDPLVKYVKTEMAIFLRSPLLRNSQHHLHIERLFSRACRLEESTQGLDLGCVSKLRSRTCTSHQF